MAQDKMVWPDTKRYQEERKELQEIEKKKVLKGRTNF
jgi:hypothetical protein